MTNSAHYVVPSLFQADITHSYSKEFLEPATEQEGKGAGNEILLNTITKWRQFDLRYQLDYSFLDHTWIDTLVALTYHPSCWGITFFPRARREGLQIQASISPLTCKV